MDSFSLIDSADVGCQTCVLPCRVRDPGSEEDSLCGLVHPSRCESSWASLIERILQVKRFVVDFDGDVAVAVTFCDVGTCASSSWAAPTGRILDAMVPCGHAAVASDFSRNTAFILMEGVLSRCSPIAYLLPEGTRCRFLYFDGDGDLVADVPSAVHLCSGFKICFGLDDCGAFQVLRKGDSVPSAPSLRDG